MFRLPSTWRDVPADMAADVALRVVVFAVAFAAAYGVQWVMTGVWLRSVLSGPGADRMLDSPLAADGYLPGLAERFLYTSLIIAALIATLGVTLYRFRSRRRYDKSREAARHAIAVAREAAQETTSAGYAIPDHLREAAERMSEPDPAPVQPEAPRRQERQATSESMWTQLELPKEQPETRERL